MSENKKRLGLMIDEKTGEEFEFVSTLVGCFAGNRRLHISKTDVETYVIGVKRENIMGEILEEQMHLTKESLSVLLSAIHLFLEHEKEDVELFSKLALDKESGYMYKTLEDLKEEQS